jgi:aldehyde:ferredoxin oxidoreductase
MARGYMGKILWVDLTTKDLKDEELDEKLCREYLGGYGLGAKIIFDRQKPGVDALSPDSIVGITTGPLTGTDGLGGSRYIMVGKSPLTGGWGDANSGGYVGPNLKFAGYDAVFFTGVSEKPVYLLIDNGKAELKDAAKIWGKDSFETEDILKAEHGKELECACIGQAGENVVRVAAVMNNKGRAAGRSGLGAVMGSKKLKAIAVKGNMKVPVAEPEKLNERRKVMLAELGGHITILQDTGTPGIFTMCAEFDDAPCKNWGGVAVIDFPTYKDIGAANIIPKQEKRYACYRCPIACGGVMKAGTGEYKYPAGAHKPEYETIAMFGSNCLNDNVESIIMANDICNRTGMDTISAGACIAFTIECYENGLITKEDTDGLEMTWGNHRSIIAMTEKLAGRDGFGDIIADGVKRAAEKIGKGSEKYAMHVGGQEFPAHDSRGGVMFGRAYGVDPTPGRHTQGGSGPYPENLVPEHDPMKWKGSGGPHKVKSSLCHATNATGTCQFVLGGFPNYESFLEQIRLITGWDLSVEEMLKIGERINNVRQAFNIREGLETPWVFPDRMMGKPPKTEGPRTGITLDREEMFREYMEAADWDFDTGKPSKEKLLELGLDDVAEMLWP